MFNLSVISLMTVFFSMSFSIVAEARVFDLRSRTFGTYFGASAGSSNLSRQPWGDSSGPATTTDDSVKLNYSGEFGVLAATQKVNFRAGVEFLQPQRLSDIKGTNGTDVLFTLDSNTRAIIPKGSVEFAIWKTHYSALIFGGSVGYAMVTMTNDYTITPPGTTAFGGVTSYIEKATGNAVDGEGFIGYEYNFSDNVTLFANVGYRYLLVSKLTHENANAAIGGAVAKDSTVLKQNGDNRTLNMSAGQAALHFRFYF